MTQGIGEGGEGFGIKGEERVWRDYKEVDGDLKRVSQSTTEDEALRKLDQVEDKMASYISFNHPIMEAKLG